MNGRSFSVTIVVPSGDPDALRTIEKSNWMGRGLYFPRGLFPEVRQREELSRTGVYVLWGSDESARLRIYVGQGDPVLPRLEQHVKRKEFWSHAVIFTSKDDSLNKAHVQYLEARLVELAAEAKRVDLANENTPKRRTLSEADRAVAEAFLQDMRLCLRLVGLNFFEKGKGAGEKSYDLVLKAKRKGIEAWGQTTGQGFVVRAGSRAVKNESDLLSRGYRKIRQDLLARGTFADEGSYYVLTQDCTFRSPSAAATVLLGRSANGRREWRDAQGRTLKEIQEAESEEL